MDKTKIPKLMLKGISQENGTAFKREIHTLDEVRESGTYTLVGNNATEDDGLPPAEYCDCKQCYFEAMLEVSRNSPFDGSTDKETIGQKLTITNSNDGSINTYYRSWSTQHNKAKWTGWQMVATGNIELIKENNDINQAFTNLTNDVNNETQRAEDVEQQLQNNIECILQQQNENLGVVSFESGAINVDNGNLVEQTNRMRSKPIYFSFGVGEKKITYNVPAPLIPTVTAAGNRGGYAYMGDKPIKRIPTFDIGDGIGTFTADGTFDNIRITFARKDGTEITQEEIDASYLNSNTGLREEVNALKNAAVTEVGSGSVDLAISDEKGNVIVRFENGGIKTKFFDSNDTLSICVIGNSYSLDSFMYLPFILLNYGIRIRLGIYYRPGGSLQNQVDEYTNATREFFYIDTNEDSSWQTISAAYTPQKAVKFRKWDIVVIQQSSTDSVSYDNFVPAARNLINLIMDSIDYPFKLGWNININRNTSGTNYDEIEASILANIAQIVKREAVDIVFPYGTAIFNARTNATLASIGDGGQLWSSDKVHLQEGLPCYIANLANVQKLFEVYYPKFSVLNDKTRPTDEEVQKWGVKGIHGASTGLTENNCRLAQLCAIAANKENFEILNIEN